MSDSAWIAISVLVILAITIVAALAAFGSTRKARWPSTTGASANTAPGQWHSVQDEISALDVRRNQDVQLEHVLALDISTEGRIRLLTQWRQDLVKLDVRRARDAKLLIEINEALRKLSDDLESR